jgi:hypothetical protein
MRAEAESAATAGGGGTPPPPASGAVPHVPAATQQQMKQPDPAAFLLPEGCDEHSFNLALKTPQASTVFDDTPSSVTFWRALTKVVPISKIAELVGNKDKEQRTAVQYLNDMNLSKSYRKLMSFAGKEPAWTCCLNVLRKATFRGFSCF